MLPQRLGGHYDRAPLPGRIHGLAAWSPLPFHARPTALTLPAGTLVRRVAQILEFPEFGVANVHLSHGQLLNRRQLRWVADVLPPRAAILGDFNMVGAALLPEFADVGPRRATHDCGRILPLRLDRCLVRGLTPRHAAVLPRGGSDHHPILMVLSGRSGAGATRRVDFALSGLISPAPAGGPGSRRASAWPRAMRRDGIGQTDVRSDPHRRKAVSRDPERRAEGREAGGRGRRHRHLHRRAGGRRRGQPDRRRPDRGRRHRDRDGHRAGPARQGHHLQEAPPAEQPPPQRPSPARHRAARRRDQRPGSGRVGADAPVAAQPTRPEAGSEHGT